MAIDHLGRELEALGVSGGDLRCLLLLPQIYAGWSSPARDIPALEALLDSTARRGRFPTDGARRARGWLFERPTRAQFQSGFALLRVLRRATPEPIVTSSDLLQGMLWAVRAARLVRGKRSQKPITPDELRASDAWHALTELEAWLEVDTSHLWLDLLAEDTEPAEDSAGTQGSSDTTPQRAAGISPPAVASQPTSSSAALPAPAVPARAVPARALPAQALPPPSLPPPLPQSRSDVSRSVMSRWVVSRSDVARSEVSRSVVSRSVVSRSVVSRSKARRTTWQSSVSQSASKSRDAREPVRSPGGRAPAAPAHTASKAPGSPIRRAEAEAVLLDEADAVDAPESKHASEPALASEPLLPSEPALASLTSDPTVGADREDASDAAYASDDVADSQDEVDDLDDEHSALLLRKERAVQPAAPFPLRRRLG